MVELLIIFVLFALIVVTLLLTARTERFLYPGETNLDKLINNSPSALRTIDASLLTRGPVVDGVTINSNMNTLYGLKNAGMIGSIPRQDSNFKGQLAFKKQLDDIKNTNAMYNTEATLRGAMAAGRTSTYPTREYPIGNNLWDVRGTESAIKSGLGFTI